MVCKFIESVCNEPIEESVWRRTTSEAFSSFSFSEFSISLFSSDLRVMFSEFSA